MANIYVNNPEVAQDVPIEVPPYGVILNGTNSGDEVNAHSINWMELQKLEEDLYIPSKPAEVVILEVESQDGEDN
jgi:hypothetical protein